MPFDPGRDRLPDHGNVEPVRRARCHHFSSVSRVDDGMSRLFQNLLPRLNQGLINRCITQPP